MDHTLGQCIEAMAALESDLVEQHGTVGSIEKRQQRRRRCRPPLGAAQVVEVAGVALSGEVQVGQHFAHTGAVFGRRRHDRCAVEAGDERGGLAVELAEKPVVEAGDGLGARQAVPGQMRHQLEIERQLHRPQLLEQREHVAALRGGDEVVGVLDAGEDAAQVGEMTHRIALEPGRQLLRCDLGEDRHRAARYRLSSDSRSAAVGVKPRDS